MPKKSRRRQKRPDKSKRDAGAAFKSAPTSSSSTCVGTGLPTNRDDIMHMLRENIVAQQTEYMSAVMDGSVADMMAPPHFDEKDIAGLPPTDMTWFVDFDSSTNIDEKSSSGYCTEVMYKVGLVMKENGSNGLPWGGGFLGEDDCDGLSFVMAFCVEVLDTASESMTRTMGGMLKSVAKACLHPRSDTLGNLPEALQMRPGRPRRVLVRNNGLMRELKPKLRRLGIPEVGIADEALVGSMASGFASSPFEDHVGAGMFSEVHEASDHGDRAGMQATVSAATGGALMRMSTESGYVDEARKPLGSWRPEGSAVPIDWFVRPPNLEEVQLGHRERMLWGWRTNMELAVERNDATKISDIAARHPRDEVKTLVEMRLLLTKAAEKGVLRACEALLEPYPGGPGANVDGVLSQGNQRQWRAVQRWSGDMDQAESQTPLNRAAQHGNTAVVALLLQRGADLNLVNTFQGAGPLHYAVARAHKDCVVHLLKGGPGGRGDMYLQDNNGHSALTLAKMMIEETGQSRFKSILSVLEDFDELGDTGEEVFSVGCCAECGKAGARAKCICGAVIYCGRECQRGHWKEHKRDHGRLMAKKERSGA